MRVLTSFFVISALVLMDSVAVSAVGSGRARPGSVTGVLMQKAQDEARMPGLDVNNCPNCEKPTPPPPPPPPIKPENPCGEVIPMLGVDICVARNACEGIKADGHSGVFDETKMKCQIPVCAHNWSGVIKKGGEDVCGLVEMGTALRCDANLFDQITVMRRTSQWVAPLMAAGGAGIGAGVGAIIDKNQNAKAAHLATLANENEAAYKGGQAGAAKIMFDGRPYDLPAQAAELRAALSGNRNLDNKIQQAINLINNCTARIFHDLVRLDVDGFRKWGRIKVTVGSDCTSDVHDNSVKFCQFQNIHASTDKTADCSKVSFVRASNFSNPYLPNNKHQNPKLEEYYFYPENNGNLMSGEISSATCLFRDSQGSAELDNDATIQMDLWRMNFLTRYIMMATQAQNSKFKSDLVTALNKFEFSASSVDSGVNNYDILNWIVVRSKNDSDNFGNVPNGTCNWQGINSLLPGEEYLGSAASVADDSTKNILMEAYGALLALRAHGNLNAELEALFGVLDSIQVNAVGIGGIHEGLGDRINKDLGKDRPWYQTATARGALIGGLAGAAGGLGYWFAEGASTFCNVGGFEQVKLNKSYSVPTFREYLLNKGFMQQ
ncbi:MAG: hypothetical protein FWE50_00395 [Alphaproteobacteria bacterium]|nr:hypothetical protein [Alphaproteobacteria bacterium]